MVDGAAGSGEFAASEFSACLARSLARSALLSLTSQIPRFSEFFSLAIPTYTSFSSPRVPPSHHRHVPTPKDVCVMSACNFEFESLLLIGFDPEFKIGICESEPFAII